MEEKIDELPKIVREKIERNRQKAIIIRQSKLEPHPYAKGKNFDGTTTIIKIGRVNYKDTGGGFLLEEHLDEEKKIENVVIPEGAIFESDKPTCEICNKQFAVSYLFDNFNYKCCDTCRDREKHKLITKTEAKQQYLLKDCDFDKREPPLKYISQKNPHNLHSGVMKLYLQIQVAERCLEVWGSEEKLEEEKQLREEKRVMSKSKKYEKQLKELRKGMRSSLYNRTTTSHEHQFGPETYDEENDTYNRKCTTCSYEENYEKM